MDTQSALVDSKPVARTGRLGQAEDIQVQVGRCRAMATGAGRRELALASRRLVTFRA